MHIQLSGHGTGVVVPKKILLLFFISAFIGSFTSCKKETVATPASQSASMLSADEAVAKSTTNFGAVISGKTNIDDEIKILNKLGVKYVRYAIVLKDFNGVDKGYEKWVNAGFKVLLNLNWDQVSGTGSKMPVAFPTNMTTYKAKLEKVLDKYHPEVAVIENEECTDQFHSGPIENYITELKTAVDVCNKRGIAVADGGIHVDYVEVVMSGAKLDGNALETKKLINAFKTMNLTYVNTHAKGPFDRFGKQNVYPSGTLEDDADYLRTQTGKPIMCNEYNQQNGSTDLMTGAVGGFKNGRFKYVIARSGSTGDEGTPLNNGTQLTALGIAYRDAVQ
jgi:hypothetical protein